MKKIYLNQKLSDVDLLKLNANYLDISFFEKVVNEDTHCLTKNKDTIFILKKNIIPNNLGDLAYKSFLNYSRYPRANRGAAAGIVDKNKLPKYVGEITDKTNTRVFYKSKDGKESNRSISNIARSAIAGYYDRQVGSAPSCR